MNEYLYYGLLFLSTLVVIKAISIIVKIRRTMRNDDRHVWMTLGVVRYHYKTLTELDMKQIALIEKMDTVQHEYELDSLYMRFKYIQTEKETIFKHLLELGIDPQVTIRDNGEDKLVKLSEAVQITKAKAEPEPEPAPKERHLSIVTTDTKET